MQYRRHLILFRCIAAAILFFMPVLVFAQAAYKEGDQVEVDVNMSSRAESAVWRKATVTKVEMWNGRVSGYFLKTADGRDIVSSETYMRKFTSPQTTTPTGNNNSKEPPNNRNGNAAIASFQAGDRVLVDKIMANDPALARWVKATVKAVDLANGRYVVTLDDFNEISVLIRPGKVWIRPLNDGSKKPEKATCSLNPPPGKAEKNAAPSVQLFQRVIYEYQNDIKRGLRLGISFPKFVMGAPFKNIITNRGRILDFLPTNVLVHPIKTTMTTCEEFDTMIAKVVTEIEYSCYKDESGKWICKNGAPRELERTSIPKD